jgi:hypothetical protein
MAAADLDGGAQPVVGLVGRHLHIHDGHVGTVGGHLAPQVVGVTGLGDNGKAGVGQQAAEPLAQEHLVLGHHNPHGRHGPNATRGGRRGYGQPDMRGGACVRHRGARPVEIAP